MKLIYNINDKPKFGKLLVFAIQQVLAIITATIVVPIITNNNAGLEGANQMSSAAALFGGCPNTTYGESVACVAITRNASIATILAAAVLAILISFLSPFVALVQTIPSFVMGGVCVALYGFIAVSGLKMIQKVDLGLNKNLFVVATILITSIGGLTLTFGQIQITSIACALILGIIVNLILNKAKETEETAE